MTKYYNWQDIFSRQTGHNAEIVIVIGARSIGKTFGLRLELVKRCIKTGMAFVNLSRYKEEIQAIKQNYFSKLQSEGFFTDYQFKVEKNTAYVALIGDNPDWKPICYFMALTAFQRDKQTTFANVRDVIFDEAILDKRDQYHRYLPYEFSLFADALSTAFREQPDDNISRHVYILGNACDLTAPYLKEYGIDKPPDFGFKWLKDNTVLLHRVEPWDADERRAQTLVGRMLDGSDAAKVAFDNEFDLGSSSDIGSKTPNARFAFAVRYSAQTFAVWMDYKTGMVYVNDHVPKGSGKPFALTKKDGAVDYNQIRKNDNLMQLLSGLHYAGNVRYSSYGIREAFAEVLTFIGIR